MRIEITFVFAPEEAAGFRLLQLVQHTSKFGLDLARLDFRDRAIPDS